MHQGTIDNAGKNSAYTDRPDFALFSRDEGPNLKKKKKWKITWNRHFPFWFKMAALKTCPKWPEVSIVEEQRKPTSVFQLENVQIAELSYENETLLFIT